MKVKELIDSLSEYDTKIEVYISDELDRDPEPKVRLGYYETYPSTIKITCLMI